MMMMTMKKMCIMMMMGPAIMTVGTKQCGESSGYGRRADKVKKEEEEEGKKEDEKRE